MASATTLRGRIVSRGHQEIDPSLHVAVRTQLDTMVASPLFCHSKHYPALLRYVVEQTLNGRSSELKERTLGFEVFGREHAYDTNSDPVVRNSASEVRKRIAQYYHEPGHEGEIRIELPLGSYIPEFILPDPYTPEKFSSHAAAPVAVEFPAVSTPRFDAALKKVSLRWTALLALPAILAGGLYVQKHNSAMNQFWGPIWDSGDSAVIGLSTGNITTNPRTEPEAEPTALEVARTDRIGFSVGMTLARITAILSKNGETFDVRRGGALSLADLQKGPAILIGGYGNPWTLRLTDKSRYTLEKDPASALLYIRDSRNPNARTWQGNPLMPYSKVKEDYAVISRFKDERTESMVLVLAGMGKDGTTAAGEFVTSPKYVEMFASQAPPHWGNKNFQIVIATEIVSGNAGPPRIVATHFW